MSSKKKQRSLSIDDADLNVKKKKIKMIKKHSDNDTKLTSDQN